MSKIDLFLNLENLNNPKLEITEKKNIIYCHQSKKHYWDDGMIRNFEEVVKYNITWKEAKKKFPNCIKINTKGK